MIRMYHYDATLEFPCLLDCYEGTPITSATGLGIGGPEKYNGGPTL
jgi:hypothetical protein